MVVEGAIASLLVEAGTVAASRGYEWYDDRERSNRVSESLGDLETEFSDRLGDRIEERAEGKDTDSALLKVGWEWDEVAEQVDAYELSFEDEREAVDDLTQRIAETVNEDSKSFDGVQLGDEQRGELREVLSDVFSEAVSEFRETVEGNPKLQDKLQNDLNVQILEELREMQESFAAVNATTYDVYDFPEERDEILEKMDRTFIEEDEAPEFVERNDGTVPEDPEPAKRFVVGPSGSGKSRIVAERMKCLSDGDLAYVMVPDKGMLSASDASSLARESFDGDLLLVWGDVHRVGQGQKNAVVKNVLTKLDDALADQGHSLYTLLEARSDRLDSLTGNLPNDFDNEHSKSIWTEYEPVWTGELDESVLHGMVGSIAEKYGVKMDEEARDALVERTEDSKSAPVYIDAALATVHDDDGELSVEDVGELSETVEGIWKEHYEHLRDEASEEWNVLVSMKALYDLNVPRYSRLVRSVYLELFDGDRTVFKPAVESLNDGRRWVNVVRDSDDGGDDDAEEVLGKKVVYKVHDTQLDAVGYSAKDDGEEISELLLDEVEDAVPEERRAPIHFYAGFSLHDWGVTQQAAVHYEKSIEINPERTPVPYDKYGLLLKNELDRPEEAEKKFKKAIEINPEYAEAYYNYGLLLQDELDEPEEAEKKFKRAIEINPEVALAYYDYGNLLWQELDEPEEAAEKYEKAIEIDPKYAAAYYNYGFLLKNELDEPEEAEKKFKKAIEHDPEVALAYNSYGNLLWQRLDEPEEAAEKYEKAIEVETEYALAYSNYGLLLKNELDEPEEAEKKFKKAIEHDPELARAHYNYGVLLEEELNEPEEATEKYEKAVSRFTQKDETQHLITSLRGLVELSVELREKETVVENCKRALEVLDEKTQVDDDGSERLWFESMRTIAKEDTVEIYRYGLENVEASQIGMTPRLFESAWDRRDEHPENSQAHGAAVSAGVALAAHLEMGMDFNSSHTAGEVLAEIDPDDLSGAQEAVYDELHPDRETEVTPDDIAESAEQYDSPTLDDAAFEARIFGKILSDLRSGGGILSHLIR